MREIIITLIIFITMSHIVSCSRENVEEPEDSPPIERYISEPESPVLVPGDFEELKFVPPLASEKITIEEDGSSDPKTNKILIFKKSEDKKELLFTIMPKTNFFYIRENMSNIYFTIEDSDLNNGLNDLWKIIISKGVIENTGIKIGDDYKFTFGGDYLCYIYKNHPFHDDNYGWFYYDSIKLLDLENGDTEIYDFYDSFPLTRQSPSCDIEALEDRFNITYFADGGGISLKGYILLSDKKFYKIK